MAVNDSPAYRSFENDLAMLCRGIWLLFPHKKKKTSIATKACMWLHFPLPLEKIVKGKTEVRTNSALSPMSLQGKVVMSTLPINLHYDGPLDFPPLDGGGG